MLLIHPRLQAPMQRASVIAQAAKVITPPWGVAELQQRVHVARQAVAVRRACDRCRHAADELLAAPGDRARRRPSPGS